MTYINHITLSTSHTRRSPRAEVSDETIRALRPWLRAAIENQDDYPLPGPLGACDGFCGTGQHQGWRADLPRRAYAVWPSGDLRRGHPITPIGRIVGVDVRTVRQQSRSTGARNALVRRGTASGLCIAAWDIGVDGRL